MNPSPEGIQIPSTGMGKTVWAAWLWSWLTQIKCCPVSRGICLTRSLTGRLTCPRRTLTLAKWWSSWPRRWKCLGMGDWRWSRGGHTQRRGSVTRESDIEIALR